MRFTTSLSQAAAAILLLATESHSSPDNDVAPSQAPLVSESFVCKDAPFKVQLMSTSPLLIYVEDFLTEQELKYLQQTSKSSLSSSSSSSSSSSQTTTNPTTTRLSHRGDEILQCIASRLHTFQGHRPPQANLEPPLLFRYSSSNSNSNPITKSTKDSTTNTHAHSTLHIWTLANTAAGGALTFPLIPSPLSASSETNNAWCPPSPSPNKPPILDCDAPYSKGITFLPRPGSAVYFLDSRPDGKYDSRTAHYTGEILSGEVEGVVFRTGRRVWVEEE
ncbi:hypothetical protein QBC34DRAFT_420096 [Podospora aff. communis PSN243]|uniref:Prolyl 4-hydroxylase alpha subunit domain-containing protein n=1 Tax=Podospora aff. communis PSN243 TaxID=3040156 RepID=A0AAV9H2L5_9PEZI|nr:hypothetical protein QBC34DRAFT_420096 [Podospora aff. communis PSN243]